MGNEFSQFFMTETEVEAQRIAGEAECDAIELAKVAKYGLFVVCPVITDKDRANADHHPYFGSDYP